MKITFFCLIISLSLPLSAFSGEFVPEYSAAAVRAAEWGDGSLVEFLIRRGADPNAAADDGRALLSAECMHCFEVQFNGTPLAERIKHIEFLIARGAKINSSDSYGVTPLLVANRVGTDELTQLLKSHGATDPDWNDIKVKAAATLVDGELLLQGLSYLVVIDGNKYTKPPTLPYEEVSQALAGSKIKIVLNSGRDLFGRNFILSSVRGGIVKVHPETLMEIEKEISLRPDYWKRLDQRLRRY